MSCDSASLAWYLAQLKPNAIRIAERNLKRQGFSVFCPRDRRTRRGGDRFTTDLHPYFPGYLFAGFDIKKGGWNAVNSTQGVSQLVSFGNRPVPVPQALMAELQAQCDAEHVLSTGPKLVQDDRVQVTTGPFSGLLAQVDRVTADQRVWILMDLLSGKTRVTVDADQLQKVSRWHGCS